MAGAGALAVGVAVCFTGFSTFQARGLLNLHDLALLPAWRGRGIGRRLLAAVEAIARARGYCKITLEVRGDNAPARALYASAGFGVAPPDAAVPMADGANSSTAITHLFCEKRLAD
ncbi:MAG: GNAT family N-acetyltransferase [Chromatiaceae bacterium]|nr:MAG: GNAT family N-acetyltransferase [Chromatiaceae bacterium]